jgi:hypothetical protein
MIGQFGFHHQIYHHDQKQEFKKITVFLKKKFTEHTQIFINYSTICFSSSKLSSQSTKKIKKINGFFSNFSY